jgi:hypothetical protein
MRKREASGEIERRYTSVCKSVREVKIEGWEKASLYASRKGGGVVGAHVCVLRGVRKGFMTRSVYCWGDALLFLLAVEPQALDTGPEPQPGCHSSENGIFFLQMNNLINLSNCKQEIRRHPRLFLATMTQLFCLH